VYRIIPLIFAALLVIGCTQARAETPAPTATQLMLEGKWAVKMTHSGGIMGLMRSIEVASDGTYTVTDERANKTFTGKLTDDELKKLQDMITDMQYTAPTMPGGVCADCFIYDIQIQSDGKGLTVQLDDISLPESGLEPLVTTLRNMMDLSLR
jgi:hypothetical protein